ncbi:MAG: Gfo/Idh/MocA family oxidoreductase [Chitinophagaceae bacterium]|nr:Gfo/Idh/MocA family oxidoreductase [Chitinophagaceae bacterium]
MYNFALIGAAGYIAPRHMAAIRDTKNNLIAAYDKFDSVGILDSFFPESHFFIEFERFDRYVDKLRRDPGKKAIDYISVCSPNYLHDSHIRFGLRSGCDVICEKPIVLNPWNIDGLLQMEKETGKKVYSILQLRIHPVIKALREKILNSGNKMFDVELTYVTSRGKWYMQSWKGDSNKSGGIATNIGVHFFDLLSYLFGEVKINRLYHSSSEKVSGYLEYSHARVKWFLSVDCNDLPEEQKKAGKRVFRSMTIDKEEIEFSEGFTDLHTRVYAEIMQGNGFGLEDARPAIATVAEIRNLTPAALTGDYHPYLMKLKS